MHTKAEEWSEMKTTGVNVGERNLSKTILTNISDTIKMNIQRRNEKKGMAKNNHIKFVESNKEGLKDIVKDMKFEKPITDSMIRFIDLFQFNQRSKNCISNVLEERNRISIELERKYGFVSKFEDRKSKKRRMCENETNMGLKQKKMKQVSIKEQFEQKHENNLKLMEEKYENKLKLMEEKYKHEIHSMRNKMNAFCETF